MTRLRVCVKRLPPQGWITWAVIISGIIATGWGCSSGPREQANRQENRSRETHGYANGVSRERMASSGLTPKSKNSDDRASFKVDVLYTVAPAFSKDRNNLIEKIERERDELVLWEQNVELTEDRLKMTAREFYVSLFSEGEARRLSFLWGVAIFRPKGGGDYKYIDRYPLHEPESKTMMREVRPGDLLWYYGMT